MYTQWNKPKVRSFKQAITAAGTPEQLGVKIRAATIAFVAKTATANATITDSGDGFLAAGFEAGDEIIITGAAQAGNNDTFHIKSVVAGTITLADAEDLTAESASNTILIKSYPTVPDGVRVVVKAQAGNTGDIYVAGSSETADAGVGAIYLDAQEDVEMYVKRTDAIWVDAGTSADVVQVIMESEEQAAA